MPSEAAARPLPPRVMRDFFLLWIGQVVSLVGSGLTGFALGVWVYQRTGSATLFSLVLLFTSLPMILVSPIAGVVVDRFDRRGVLMAANAAAALATLALVLLLASGRLEIWHLYVVVTATSVCGAFVLPAFTAATTLMVPREHYARASGLVQSGQAGAQIAAPLLAGVLMAVYGLPAVILADFATFLFALLALVLLRIPRPEGTGAAAERGSVWRESVFGWRYIAARPGLFALLAFFAAANFGMGMIWALATPLVLSFASAEVLGTILSTAGVGMLVGGMVMGAWGGPRRRVYGVVGAGVLLGLFTALAGVRPSAPLIGVALFGAFFCAPVMNACSQAIWQVKVPPEVQGRVFATRGMVAWSTLPLAHLAAGPLADHVFGPLLAPGGPLAGSLGGVLGTGPGRGMGLFLVLVGVLLAIGSAAAFFHPRLRGVEDELPDAAVPAAPAAPPPEEAPVAGGAPAGA